MIMSMIGLKGWVGGGGAKSQDGEKARSSLNHSIRDSLSRRFVHVNKEKITDSKDSYDWLWCHEIF
jgi:hypothetical protein